MRLYYKYLIELFIQIENHAPDKTSKLTTKRLTLEPISTRYRKPCPITNNLEPHCNLVHCAVFFNPSFRGHKQ